MLVGSVRRICSAASASPGIVALVWCEFFRSYFPFPVGARALLGIGDVDCVRYIVGLFTVFSYEQIVACLWEGR